MAIVAKPIQGLLKNDVQFKWSHEHEETFKRLKNLLLKHQSWPLTMRKNLSVTVASQFGLGAVLLQGGQPVAYAT